MNKKGVSWIIIVVVVIAIVVIGGAAYWALTNTGTGEPTPTPTPTPSNTIETATSIGFKVDAYGESYAFTAKNLGTSNILLRVDETDSAGASYVYVLNQVDGTIYLNYNAEWYDYSDEFASYWSGANSGIIGHTAFDGYMTELASNWSGTGSYDYNSGDNAIHIYDIVINPALDDILFAHT